MVEQDREELLSAYLDGEVSPEEKARVERWLGESAELRQLHDELLALRGDLRALPRHPIGHDLAATVMQRSESAASPRDDSQTKVDVLPEDPSEGTSLGGIFVEWWNRGSQSRRLLWPALAVAAALAILVFDARQRPDDASEPMEVAQAPDSEAAATLEAEAPRDQPDMIAAPDAAREAVSEKSVEDLYSQQPRSMAPPAAAEESRAKRSPPAADVGDRSVNSNRMRSGLDADATRRQSPANFAEDRGTMRGSGAAGANVLGTPEVALQETIVCPVTTEYLEQRQFEKLLDENKVTWKRLPVPPQLQVQTNSPAARVEPLESLGRAPLQTLYLVNAKSEQVNGILSQVPQSAKLMEGNRLGGQSGAAYSGKSLTDRKVGYSASGVNAGVQVMLVAPTEPQPAAAPAVPKASAPR